MVNALSLLLLFSLSFTSTSLFSVNGKHKLIEDESSDGEKSSKKHRLGDTDDSIQMGEVVTLTKEDILQEWTNQNIKIAKKMLGDAKQLYGKKYYDDTLQSIIDFTLTNPSHGGMDEDLLSYKKTLFYNTFKKKIIRNFIQNENPNISNILYNEQLNQFLTLPDFILLNVPLIIQKPFFVHYMVKTALNADSKSPVLAHTISSLKARNVALISE